jgi:hypothetical protein
MKTPHPFHRTGLGATPPIASARRWASRVLACILLAVFLSQFAAHVSQAATLPSAYFQITVPPRPPLHPDNPPAYQPPARSPTYALTLVPWTPTQTASRTPIPPTATSTSTPLPPSATPTWTPSLTPLATQTETATPQTTALAAGIAQPTSPPGGASTILPRLLISLIAALLIGLVTYFWGYPFILSRLARKEAAEVDNPYWSRLHRAAESHLKANEREKGQE